MRGQQAIQAAVVRGEEVPAGHVVTEEWPKQTYRVGKSTKSWGNKCKEKEAKKRYRKNKQARTCRAEHGEAGATESQPKKKDQSAKRPKHVQRREQVKQEREAKRLLIQQKQEERKREREEHRMQKQSEREERSRERERKRERRLRMREERERERQRRRAWHEEVKCQRERRLARKQERMARQASAALAQPSALSTILVDSQALTSLPKPP